MANALYKSGESAFARGDIDWVNDTIVAVLVDTTEYTVDINNHDYLDDVPAAARRASAELTGKTVASGGVCDADDVTFASVAAGDACQAVLLYRNSGSEASSQLIAWFDTMTGLPVTPVGDDIVAQWSNGDNKVFRL